MQIKIKNCNKTNYTASQSNRTIKYIVIHYTGNAKDTAAGNASYFANNKNIGASAHFFVDDNEIYQSVAPKDIAWHCGTKGTYYHPVCRNINSIGIEMSCSQNYKVSEKTKQNTINFVKELMIKYNIPSSNVIRHYDVTHKSCPAQMAGQNNAEWLEFKKQLSGDEENMTQEQFNKMFDNYLAQMAKEEPTAGWGKEAVDWAIKEGLATGGNNGEMMAKKLITRQEVFTLLKRFAEKFGK